MDLLVLVLAIYIREDLKLFKKTLFTIYVIKTKLHSGLTKNQIIGMNSSAIAIAFFKVHGNQQI